MTDPNIILDAHNAAAISNAHDSWLNPPEDHIGESNKMVDEGDDNGE